MTDVKHTQLMESNSEIPATNPLKPGDANSEIPASKSLRFSEFQLEKTLFESIDSLQYQECTPIQSLSIPHILVGKDVAGLAQTGTGKTAAFLVPLMDRILKAINSSVDSVPNTRSFTDWKTKNYILILVPTRELAEQVLENVHKLGKNSGLDGVAIYGGTGYEQQKAGLLKGVSFVVATPGRLIDLYKEHICDFKQIRAVVFDEADRMFDMGFRDDMKYILQRIPRSRQMLLFSATLNFEVLNIAYTFGAEPIEIDISRDQAKAENVKDAIFHVGQSEKPQFLLSLLKKHNPRQVIIFSNFKNNVEHIAEFLNKNQVPAMAISSLLTQPQRQRVMTQFKAENEKNILVATDVAARGLDIKGVDMVINYEISDDPESYIHRIGRTGRAGQEGLAFSLVCDLDLEALKRVEQFLKHKLVVEWLEDSDLIKDFQPFFKERSSFPLRSQEGNQSSFDSRKTRGPSSRRQGGGSYQLKDRQQQRGRGSAQTQLQLKPSQQSVPGERGGELNPRDQGDDLFTKVEGSTQQKLHRRPLTFQRNSSSQIDSENHIHPESDPNQNLRPTRGGDRPTRGGDRPTRGGDRPSRGGDRPMRGDGDRPSRDGDRYLRSGERNSSRSGDRDADRSGHRGSSRNRGATSGKFHQRRSSVKTESSMGLSDASKKIEGSTLGQNQSIGKTLKGIWKGLVQKLKSRK